MKISEISLYFNGLRFHLSILPKSNYLPLCCFEGLGDNTYFWNYTTGWTLILGRFLPIVGQVAIAGLLAGKKYVPESAGTLKTDTVTFGVMTFAVIFIVAALSFFPAHALSTIAEHFSL